MCRFASLPVRDQLSLLTKVRDGIITLEKMHSTIGEIHRTIAGMKSIMTLVTAVMAEEPDSDLGKWYTENGFSAAKPFELNDLYVSNFVACCV